MYTEKINIYIPEKTAKILENDAIMFEFYKKDGKTINKNRFLSMLIIGYYDDYVKESRELFNSIIKNIESKKLSKQEKEDIANNILKEIILPEIPSRKGKNPKRLSLKPTKDTEFLIQMIMNELGGNDYISQYFCRLIMSYCEKPFSKREQILFKSNYECLIDACITHKNVSFSTIWNTQIIHDVIPYKIVTGPEEMFNYLLCSEKNRSTGIQETKSYRLNRISRITQNKNNTSIDETVKLHLEKMLQHGPQYMINDDEESCVRLTASGERNFNRIYYGRPTPERIEKINDDYLYYFTCSKDQVFFYFRRFGYEDIEILSPKSLRKKIQEFHLNAARIYEKNY